MSFTRDFNKDPLNHRYIDEHNCTEYIFAGFIGRISQTQKKKLIKRFGRPREYKPSLVDMKELVINYGAPSWEMQVITFHQNEGNKIKAR
jgi:hypothetical protein